jgi:TatD DNase family protein
MLIDTHAHLNDKRFDEDLDDVLERALLADVQTIVNVGYDLESSRRAIALAEDFDFLYAAVCLHPHDSRELDKHLLQQFRELCAHPRVVAVGETGLDFHYDNSPREDQRRAFAEFIHLAGEVGLPLIVHDRDAHADCLAILDKESAPGQRVVFHCFSGNADFARECVARGYVLGVAGLVTFPKEQRLPQAVQAVGLANLVVETDCPYLAPQTHRGKRNEPSYIIATLAKVAELTGVSYDDCAAATTATARGLYGI